VNTNGLTVTWVSGDKFTYLFNGISLVIGGTPYPVASVNSPTSITLGNSAGVQAGVAYSGTLPTGDVFADSQAYVVPTINLAWRRLLEKLDVASHPRLRKEIVLFQIPATTNLDPASQQWIDWTNFFDGSNELNPDTTVGLPTLPQDFMAPLEIWERQSAGDSSVLNLLGFQEMNPTVGHLQALAKSNYNGVWDWRDDALYVRGATIPTDWRLSYRKYLGDIIPVDEGFDATPIPIMRSARALSYYAAAEFVEPRGGTLAAGWYAQGDEAVEMLNNRAAKTLQFTNVRRRAVYNSGGRRF
jgi:hypothetical protein